MNVHRQRATFPISSLIPRLRHSYQLALETQDAGNPKPFTNYRFNVDPSRGVPHLKHLHTSRNGSMAYVLHTTIYTTIPFE